MIVVIILIECIDMQWPNKKPKIKIDTLRKEMLKRTKK